MFRDFVEHYHMTALPAGPYKPKHKALVEGAVKIIYRTIFYSFKQRTFFSLADLNTAIREALVDHNNKLLTGRPYSRRQLFEEIEKSDLQPLPAHMYQYWKEGYHSLLSGPRRNLLPLRSDSKPHT
jgi:hypothetical protein